MKPLAMPFRGRRWLLAAVLLSLLLRVPFFGLPMISDEGGYAYVADRWLDGEGSLYHDLWVSRPQGIFVVYGLILQAPGSSIAGIRLGAWLASVLTLVCVWRYARQWAGRGTAAIAGLAGPPPDDPPPAKGEWPRLLHTLEGWTWGLAFSPDGKSLAAGVWGGKVVPDLPDGGVILWDVVAGKRATVLKGYRTVKALAFLERAGYAGVIPGVVAGLKTFR